MREFACFFWISLFVIVVSSSGCRHAPPLPLSAALSADRFEERSLADPALRAFLEQKRGTKSDVTASWPKLRWSLDDLMLAAIYFQPDLRTALASVLVVTASVETARQRPNPTFVAQPQFVSNPASGISPWLSTFQLNWTLETGSKRAHRVAVAQARARAAEFQVPTAIWKLRGRLNAAAVALEAAELRRKFQIRAFEAEGRLVELLEDRVRAGALATSSVLPKRLVRIQLQSDVAASDRRIREARARLASAIGIPLGALENVELVFFLETKPERIRELTSSIVRRAALLGRADVRAMLAEYDAAESDVKLQLAKQYPNVKFGPSYEFDQQSNKWGLTFQVALPLMNQNQGPIDEALARRSLVAARFEALQARVIAEVSAASESLHGSLAEMGSARSLVEVARLRRARAARALGLGAIDRLAVLEATVQMERARVLLTGVRERTADSLARLEQAVQPLRSFMESSLDESVDPADGGAQR